MTFGEFFKRKRLEKKMTLRKFCEEFGFDPGNISKLERGLMSPPHADEKLSEYTKALGIKKGSDDYLEFFDLASAGNRNFSVKNISDEELLNKIPVLFRTLDNKALTEEKLDKIIAMVKKEAEG